MSKSRIPTVKCEVCNGTGFHPIPESLWEVLAAVSLNAKIGGLTALELTQGLTNSKITPNAFNNRLEKLRKMGLVTRSREGKFWRYRRASK